MVAAPPAAVPVHDLVDLPVQGVEVVLLLEVAVLHVLLPGVARTAQALTGGAWGDPGLQRRVAVEAGGGGGVAGRRDGVGQAAGAEAGEGRLLHITAGHGRVGGVWREVRVGGRQLRLGLHLAQPRLPGAPPVPVGGVPGCDGGGAVAAAPPVPRLLAVEDLLLAGVVLVSGDLAAAGAGLGPRAERGGARAGGLGRRGRGAGRDRGDGSMGTQELWDHALSAR